jgi:uncharacterized membrane protein
MNFRYLISICLSASILGRLFIFFGLNKTVSYLIALLLCTLIIGKRPFLPKDKEWQDIGLFVLLFLLNLGFCFLWPEVYSLGERIRDFALSATYVRNPLNVNEPWAANIGIKYYTFWYEFGAFLNLFFRSYSVTYYALVSFSLSLLGTSCYIISHEIFLLSKTRALIIALIICYGGNFAALILPFTGNLADWWGPSRVIDGAINEFPSWSFLLGDAHPHYLNLGFIAYATLLFLQALILPWSTACTVAYALILIPLILRASNPWDLPLWLGLVVAFSTSAFFSKSLRFKHLNKRETLLLLLGAFASLIIFTLSIHKIPPGGEFKVSIYHSTLNELWQHWGIILGGLSLYLLKRYSETSYSRLSVGIFLGSLLVANNLKIGLIFLLSIIALSVIDAWRSKGDSRQSYPYALILLSLFYIFFTEIIFLDDAYGGVNERMNTIFKVYNFTFPLFSLGIYALFRSKIFLIVASLSSLFFLHTAFFIRPVDKEKNFLERDELSFLESSFPGVREAVTFLRRVPGDPIILEHPGAAYTESNYLSSLSGMPSYLGWENHVGLLIGDFQEITHRKEVVIGVYEGLPCVEKVKILKNEEIKFVAFGPLERKAYPLWREENFKCLTVAFRKFDHIIYIVN